MDLANMTIVEGDTGLIVIDPLLTTQTARAALDLYLAHRPAKPVVAVVYTHSHADHFGGVKGVTGDAEVAAGKVRIYAPEGFLDHAVAENIIAGNAMSRRARYQFGSLLPPGERGHVDTGLGKALSRGSFSLIAPTDSVTPSTLRQRIDGVEVEFWGRERDEPGGGGRPGQRGGARAGRPCPRAAGLPGRGRHLARRLPERRAGAAPGPR